MILYHAVSAYQLLSFIVHHETYTKDKKSILLIASSLKDKFSRIDYLNHFFDEIWDFRLMLPLQKEKNAENDITTYFNRLFSGHHHSVHDFETIYLGCAHYLFGIYLSLQNIPYIFYEDAAGLLSRPKILENINSKAGIRHILAERYELYTGAGKAVKACLCNMAAQASGYVNEKMQNFEVVSELKKLPHDIKNRIMYFFQAPEKIDIPKGTIMLLTQHFSNLEILSFQDHVLIYQMIMDYYFAGQPMIIKPHPSDVLYYDLLFHNATVVRENFPSELLPALLSKPLKTMATISSTAIDNLRYAFNDIFELGNRFEKEFKGLHRLYAALKVAEVLKISSIGLIGVNESAVVQMMHRSDISLGTIKLTDPHQAQLILVDELGKETKEPTQDQWSSASLYDLISDHRQERAFVFINRLQDYRFYDIDKKFIWKDILAIILIKRRLPNLEFHTQLNTETVYFYTANERWRETVNRQAYEKKLEYTGLSISKVPLSDEQQRMKALEGILAATEKRLLYYINREKELLKQLEDKK